MTCTIRCVAVVARHHPAPRVQRDCTITTNLTQDAYWGGLMADDVSVLFTFATFLATGLQLGYSCNMANNFTFDDPAPALTEQDQSLLFVLYFTYPLTQ